MDQIVGVNVAEHPLTEYQNHLRHRVGLAETSVRVYVVALRRMFKHLSEEDCANPQMLAYYRASLSKFLRGAMGVAWRHYRDFAEINGVTDLADLPGLPPYRFPHPLYPDVNDILMQWPLAKAAAVTWRELRQLGTPELVHAFERVEQFHGIPHTSEDALASPYREWVLEHIARSADAMTKHRGVEKTLLAIYERASRLDAPVGDLKRLYAIFVDRRLLLVDRRGLEANVGEILAKEIPWETMNEELLRLIRGNKASFIESVEGRRDLLFW
jgi:hypothetical protein